MNYKSYPLVDVKQFGAKGDGVHDDTKSIQKAVDYVLSQTQSIQLISHNGKKLPYVGSSPKLYFPNGKYLISKTVQFGSYVFIEGENAILIPAKDNITAFKGDMWQCIIDGLQFIGFDTAIKIDTGNTDQGKIVISNCTFMGNKVSLYVEAQSSLVRIDNSRFSHNEKVLIVKSDKSIFESNWVKSGRMKGVRPSQVYVSYGVMHFYNNILVPNMPINGTVEPAWINNYGSINAYSNRQGGESGSFTLINNFAKARTKYPIIPNAVIIRDSESYAVYGNTKTYKQPALLRLIESPNSIVIEGVRGLVDARLIDYSRELGSTNLSNTEISISNISKYSNSVSKGIISDLRKRSIQ